MVPLHRTDVSIRPADAPSSKISITPGDPMDKPTVVFSWSSPSDVENGEDVPESTVTEVTEVTSKSEPGRGLALFYAIASTVALTLFVYIIGTLIFLGWSAP